MTDEARAIDDFTGEEVRRVLAVLWRSELPIALVMQVSRELGDEMTVRDVFVLAAQTGDPMAEMMDAMTDGIE